MKTLKTLFLEVISFAAIFLNTQKVHEIVSKQILAMGGAKKLASPKKMERNLNTQGIYIVLTLTTKDLTGMTINMGVMGT